MWPRGSFLVSQESGDGRQVAEKERIKDSVGELIRRVNRDG